MICDAEDAETFVTLHELHGRLLRIGTWWRPLQSLDSSCCAHDAADLEFFFFPTYILLLRSFFGPSALYVWTHYFSFVHAEYLSDFSSPLLRGLDMVGAFFEAFSLLERGVWRLSGSGFISSV